MKKVIFLDRDGTIVHETEDYLINSFDKLNFLPNCIQNLAKIAKELDYELVMITNQDGLGTDEHPEEKFWPVHDFILKVLEAEGIQFSNVFIDKTYPHENAPTRKPQTALLSDYINDDYDLKNSYVIGDRLTDMELAKNLDAKGIWINDGSNLGSEEVSSKMDELNDVIQLETTSWYDIYTFLKLGSRIAEVERNTRETEIHVKLNLDGTGKAKIETGIGFFNHMLEQIARHALVDLELTCKGDLHIDEHHTIEDTALALGECFHKALGNKMGLMRYGYCLPMDDSIATAAIDFGGRPWLVWNAEFKREKIGEMPTEMFYHFFKSFADASKSNINIKVEGDNEHHKAEAVFKAFAKAILMAKKRDGETAQLPSTKGMLE